MTVPKKRKEELEKNIQKLIHSAYQKYEEADEKNTIALQIKSSASENKPTRDNDRYSNTRK